jgi:hypothetical protein
MTIMQDKALEFLFCEPIIEGLWNRLMQDKLTEEDTIWEVFKDRKDLEEIAIGLEDMFKEVFHTGYLQGVNLLKGQSVI